MRAWLLILALAAVPGLAQQRESLVSVRVSLADERPGVRHVKWLRRIEVKRLPD